MIVCVFMALLLLWNSILTAEVLDLLDKINKLNQKHRLVNSTFVILSDRIRALEKENTT